MSLVVPPPPSEEAIAKAKAAMIRTLLRTLFKNMLLPFVLCLLLWIFSHLGNGFLIFPQRTVEPSNEVEVPKTNTRAVSPLPQEIMWIMDTNFGNLSFEHAQIFSNIEKNAYMEIKTFTIPEVQYNFMLRGKLSNYVQEQMTLGYDVISKKQFDVVLNLINNEVEKGSIVIKEIGIDGSLKSSMVVALIYEQFHTIYFKMVATSVEPRLGWRFINRKERNTWNNVISDVVDLRMKHEIMKIL